MCLMQAYYFKRVNYPILNSGVKNNPPIHDKQGRPGEMDNLVLYMDDMELKETPGCRADGRYMAVLRVFFRLLMYWWGVIPVTCRNWRKNEVREEKPARGKSASIGLLSYEVNCPIR